MSAGSGFGALSANISGLTGFFSGQDQLNQRRSAIEQQAFQNLSAVNNAALRQDQFGEQTRQFELRRGDQNRQFDLRRGDQNAQFNVQQQRLSDQLDLSKLRRGDQVGQFDKTFDEGVRRFDKTFGRLTDADKSRDAARRLKAGGSGTRAGGGKPITDSTTLALNKEINKFTDGITTLAREIPTLNGSRRIEAEQKIKALIAQRNVFSDQLNTAQRRSGLPTTGTVFGGADVREIIDQSRGEQRAAGVDVNLNRRPDTIANQFVRTQSFTDVTFGQARSNARFAKQLMGGTINRLMEKKRFETLTASEQDLLSSSEQLISDVSIGKLSLRAAFGQQQKKRLRVMINDRWRDRVELISQNFGQKGLDAIVKLRERAFDAALPHLEKDLDKTLKETGVDPAFAAGTARGGSLADDIFGFLSDDSISSGLSSAGNALANTGLGKFLASDSITSGQLFSDINNAIPQGFKEGIQLTPRGVGGNLVRGGGR